MGNCWPTKPAYEAVEEVTIDEINKGIEGLCLDIKAREASIVRSQYYIREYRRLIEVATQKRNVVSPTKFNRYVAQHLYEIERHSKRMAVDESVNNSLQQQLDGLKLKREEMLNKVEPVDFKPIVFDAKTVDSFDLSDDESEGEDEPAEPTAKPELPPEPTMTPLHTSPALPPHDHTGRAFVVVPL